MKKLLLITASLLLSLTLTLPTFSSSPAQENASTADPLQRKNTAVKRLRKEWEHVYRIYQGAEAILAKSRNNIYKSSLIVQYTREKLKDPEISMQAATMYTDSMVSYKEMEEELGMIVLFLQKKELAYENAVQKKPSAFAAEELSGPASKEKE